MFSYEVANNPFTINSLMFSAISFKDIKILCFFKISCSSFSDQYSFFLSEINKTIIKTVYNEFEEGKKEIYDYTILFEDEEIINHITSIMAEDYGISEIDKGIEDILKTYKKDKLISKRNKIMKEIEENTDKEILKKLENELNATIIELAKTK